MRVIRSTWVYHEAWRGGRHGILIARCIELADYIKIQLTDLNGPRACPIIARIAQISGAIFATQTIIGSDKAGPGVRLGVPGSCCVSQGRAQRDANN